ncbi:hypothetical protein IMSAGC022_00212 [Alistipes sp.]|nr:hypothetical protein IMSAGC022_00212 [Alistipes sp.]
MKQEEVKVSFYLKKNVFGKPRAEANSFALCRGEKRCTKVNESDAAGRCPVMARLAVGGSKCVFGTKLTAPWPLLTSGRMKGKSAAAIEINRRLDELRASAIGICRELSAARERVTAEEIKCRLPGMASGHDALLGYFGRFVERFEKHVGVDSSVKSAPVDDYAASVAEPASCPRPVSVLLLYGHRLCGYGPFYDRQSGQCRGELNASFKSINMLFEIHCFRYRAIYTGRTYFLAYVNAATSSQM